MTANEARTLTFTAEAARTLTLGAEELAHNEYEKNMNETLSVIYAEIKKACGMRKYTAFVACHEGLNSKRTARHYIGPTAILEYKGTWPDCWTVVSKAGEDLLKRLSTLHFTVIIDHSGLKIDWTPVGLSKK